MSQTECELLRLEIAKHDIRAKVVHLEGDGFYMLRPWCLMVSGDVQRGQAEVQYLGSTYAAAVQELREYFHDFAIG